MQMGQGNSEPGKIRSNPCSTNHKYVWIWPKQVQVINGSTCLTYLLFRPGLDFELLTYLTSVTRLLNRLSQVRYPSIHVLFEIIPIVHEKDGLLYI